LSVTPTFVKVSKDQNKSFANKLDKFKTDVDTPLIAILTLNTLAHTVGAIAVVRHYLCILQPKSLPLLTAVSPQY